jgi:hypothetical protein
MFVFHVIWMLIFTWLHDGGNGWVTAGADLKLDGKKPRC